VNSVVELSRWQFAITTVYHFLFVPISIGMAGIVAGFQTAWYRTRNPQWMRLTRFFGKIMLLSFAVGVVTGIVQEFQFGMNWAGYSRYVGSVFGAPLAVEALAAFFIESTFLGIWIFGYKRISEGWHLATIWLAAIGSAMSAYFILAANDLADDRDHHGVAVYRVGSAAMGRLRATAHPECDLTEHYRL